MKKLFKISEVAKFLSITTTTLRHYEREGLIKPYFIDPKTKYRYYNSRDISEISYIVLLKRTGIPLQQIKEYLQNNNSIDAILSGLKEQKAILEDTIKQLQAIANENTNEKINIITLPKSSYIYNEYTITGIDEAYSKLEVFFSEVLTRTKIETPLVFIETTKLEFELNELDIIIGIEVVETDCNVTYREEQKALEIFHKGSYESLFDSHKLLIQYAKENNLKLKGNVLHYFYESFHLRVNHNDFITKIIMPIE